MGTGRGDHFVRYSLAGARWASLGFGTLLLARPAIGTAAGLGDDHRLVRAAGAIDLTLGLGLSFGKQPARWMRGRLLGNVAVGAIAALAYNAGGVRRGRSLGLLATMGVLGVVDSLTIWQLRHRH